LRHIRKDEDELALVVEKGLEERDAWWLEGVEDLDFSSWVVWFQGVVDCDYFQGVNVAAVDLRGYAVCYWDAVCVVSYCNACFWSVLREGCVGGGCGWV
jgi:hypothetical protein